MFTSSQHSSCFNFIRKICLLFKVYFCPVDCVVIFSLFAKIILKKIALVNRLPFHQMNKDSVQKYHVYDV